MSDDPKLTIVHPQKPDQTEQNVPKPGKFDLNKFRSKSPITAASVETLLTALPLYSISQAKDFVRLHPDEDKYWSPELCFVNIPIKGQKRDTLHLIGEELAMQFLPPDGDTTAVRYWCRHVICRLQCLGGNDVFSCFRLAITGTHS